LFKKTALLLFFFLCISLKGNAQSKFYFLGNNKKQPHLKFKLINNLIIIPIKINGIELSFILDTGVDKTILFDRNFSDSLVLKNIEKISLRGLGDGKAVTALLSKNNQFRIKNMISNYESIFIILKDNFNLSSRLGTTIHGVIGYSLLKDVIVKINYRTKKITFYDPAFFRYKKCRKCATFPLEFYRNKPYIDIAIQLDTIKNKKTDVKMLIDSGGSDAVWLFEHTKEEIKTPKRYFSDVLGEGFSGTIYGNRSRIPEISLGKFAIKNPTVSFLDTLATFNARQFKDRNGSIGGGILKRFTVWIDYPNKQLKLKKNANFKDQFNYNMSGLNVIYNGMILVKEKKTISELNDNGFGDNNTKVINFVTSYQYKFKPSYKIDHVTKGSPAAKAGILAGDILIKLNRKKAYQYQLKDINGIFQERDQKKIRITIERKGVIKNFEFRLEKKI